MACAEDDPFPLVKPEAVHAQLAKSVGESATEINAALERTRRLLPTASSRTQLAHLFGTDTVLARLARDFVPLPAPLDAAALVDTLKERVFSEASYEGRGVYRVDPSLVCAAGNAACASAFAALDAQLWVEVPSADTLAILVRLGGDAPVMITLAPDEVNVTVDFDVLQRQAPALAAVFGLPALSLAGAASLVLRSDDVRASLFGSIDRPLDLRAGEDIAFASANTGIVLEALAFHSTDLGDLDIQLGATRIARRVEGKRLALDLAALSLQAPVFPIEHQEPLVLHNLSVGDRPAVFSIDGVLAQSVEINPDDGHELDVFFQRDDGITTVDATPRLDLRFTTNHAVLGEPAPAFDVTRVQVDGRLIVPTDDRFEVSGGAFSIETAPAGAGFSARDGQCVTTHEAPLAWTVGACP